MQKLTPAAQRAFKWLLDRDQEYPGWHRLGEFVLTENTTDAIRIARQLCDHGLAEENLDHGYKYRLTATWQAV